MLHVFLKCCNCPKQGFTEALQISSCVSQEKWGSVVGFPDACCKLASFISLFCHESNGKIFIYYFYLHKTSVGFKAFNFLSFFFFFLLC